MTTRSHINPDRALGAYLAPAIGDAMGGPVECMHAARIKRLIGPITGLLPYRKPPGLPDLGPGYALRPDPGSVTDDTFIRAQFTRFYIETHPPRTPAMLATWLLANADFNMWWPPMTEPLRAADPSGAAAEVRKLCPIWKAPLEQDLLAAAQAGLAEALRDGATVDSIVGAMLVQCGPLAAKLLQRGLDIAHRAPSSDDLIARIYDQALLAEAPTESDAPLPPPLKPPPDTDDPYASILFAEQIPLALAAFVFAQGDPARALPQACMFGRDADSIATTCASWAGALHGERGLPKEWVEAVCQANRDYLDLRALAHQLLEVKPG